MGCGDISEDKANWLLEQAGYLIPEDPEQITLSQYEHLLSDKVHNVIQEVLQENRVGFKIQDSQLVLSIDAISFAIVLQTLRLVRCFAHIWEL